MLAQGIDKRRFKRFLLEESVSVKYSDSHQCTGALSYDVSSGGIKLSCNVFIPLKSSVELSITLNDLSVMRCTGRVIRIQRKPHSEWYEVGLEFEEDSLLFEARKSIGSVFEDTYKH